MAEQNISVGIDSAAAQLALRKLNKLFKEQGLSIREVVKAGESLNEKQKGVAASFSGVLASGQKFTATLQRVINKNGALRKEYRLTSDAIETYGAAQERVTQESERAAKRQAKAAAELAKQQRQTSQRTQATKFVQTDVPRILGKLPSTGSPQETARLEASIRSAEQGIASGKFSRQQLKTILADIRQDSKAVFTGVEADAANAARRIIASHKAVIDSEARVLKATQASEQAKGKLQEKSRLETKQQIRDKQSQQFQKLDFPTVFGKIPTQAKSTEVGTIENAKSAIAKLISSGEISRSQFRRIFETISKDSTATFVGAEKQAAVASRKIIETLNAVDNRSKALAAADQARLDAKAKLLDRNNRLEGIQAAKVAQQSIQQKQAKQFASVDTPRLFGDIPSGAKDSEVKRILDTQRAAQKLIETGKITRGAFETVFKVISQDSKATFSGMEADAAKAARAIIAAFNVVNTRLKKDTDTVSNNFRRLNEAKLFATKDVKANFGSIPAAAQPEDIARIQNAIAASSKLIETGKLSRKQFEEIFKVLQTNGRATFVGLEAQGAKSLRSIQIAFDKAGSSGLNAAKAVILSWTGVVRIFAVQTLHLAIGRVIFSFGEMINKSAELSTKIAQIQTITQDAAASTEVWSRGLKNLSNSFGIDIIEVATAAYDALSNQAARGTDVLGFLSKAAIFAKITNSNLTNSVNLLTAVTNSYRNEAISTSRAAEIFFKVIDLGRVTADELSGSLGTVLQPASQLGIDIREVGAAIATLSQQGINADVTLTLLRNVFVGLIKPTKEMQALINSWGVPTGEAAVKTFGWLGVIEKLSHELQTGGISRLGELEGDIRKLTGTLGLTKNIDIFKKSLVEIGQSADSFGKAEKALKESFGDRFKKQIQEAGNVFNIDLGEKLLKSVVTISESFGGLGKVIKNLSDPFISIASTFASFGSTLIAIVKPVGSFVSTLGLISPILNLATSFVTGYTIALGLNKVISLAVGDAYGKKTRLLKSYVAMVGVAIQRLGMMSVSVINGVKDFGLFIRNTGSLIKNFGLAATATLRFKQGIAGLSTSLKTVVASLGKIALNTKGVITAIAIAIALATRLKDVRAEAERVKFNALEDEQNRKSTLEFEKFDKQLEITRRNFIDTHKSMEQESLVAVSEINKQITLLTDKYLNAQQTVQSGLGINLDSLQKKIDSSPQTEASDAAKAGIELIKNSQQVVKQLNENIDLSKFESQLAAIESKFGNISKITKNGLIDPFSNLTEKTDFVLKNIEELRQKAVKLYDEGNIEDARLSLEKAEEIAKLLEGSNPAKTIADLAESAKKDLSDLQLNALAPQKKKISLTENAKSLEAKALSLFNLGNIEDAKKLFDQVDSIFDQITDKEKSTSKDLAKLGVRVAPKKNDLQEQILQKRLIAIETGAQKLAKGESLAQKIAKQRLDAETKLQKTVATTVEVLVEMNTIQGSILQNSSRIDTANIDATTSAKTLGEAYKTADDRVRDLLLRLEEARGVVARGENETDFLPSPRKIKGMFGVEASLDSRNPFKDAPKELQSRLDEFKAIQQTFDVANQSGVLLPPEEFKKRADAIVALAAAYDKFFKAINVDNRIGNGAPMKDWLQAVPELKDIDLTGQGTDKVNSFKTAIEEVVTETQKMRDLFPQRQVEINKTQDQLKDLPVQKQLNAEEIQKLQQMLDKLKTTIPEDLSKKLSSTTDASKIFTGTTQENLTNLNLKLSETIAKVQVLGEAFKAIPGGTASFNFQPTSVQQRQDSFLPTLQALNSGGNSRTAAASQVVDNSVQVGDIILNVDGSGNDAAVYERVVANIRRGIRSKTLRLEG